MADKLEVDSGWVVATLNTICEKVAVLPGIEEHLARQNDAIKKQMATGLDHELRLLGLERTASDEKRRWAVVGGVLLKVLPALGIPLILAHIFGLY